MGRLLQWTLSLHLGALLAFSGAVPSLAGPDPEPLHPAIATDVGYRDFSFGSGTLATPTADKPQSKLWWNDASWWGCLWDPTAAAHRIHRFDPVAHSWTSVGPNADNRPNTLVDVLWDGTRLYIVSHLYDNKGDFRLHSYTYDVSTGTYALRSGFPVVMNTGDAEALTIAKDGTGKLWISWEESDDIMVNRSTTGDALWGTPFRLPVQGGDTSGDDICGITAFGNRIGILWSNQNDNKIYFATHVDGQAETTWQAREEALADALLGTVADDHLNLALACDVNYCVYAITKTSLHGVGLPQLYLLRRSASGTWTRHVVANDEDDHTRPILLIDDQNRKLYVIATSGTGDNGIYLKTSELDNISFPSGVGVPFIVSSVASEISNATSTKQAVNGTTDLLIIASDENGRYYYHNTLDLPNGVPKPDLAVSPTAYSYGDVLVGTSTSKIFLVVNTGTANIQVTSTSVLGTNASLFSITSGGGAYTLAPGGTRNVAVAFVPTSLGDKSAILSLASNDPDENPFDVALYGAGVQPDIAVNPTAYGYGYVLVGSSASSTFVVQNTGSASLQVTSTSLVGTNASLFSITSGGGVYTLAPGGTRDVVVAFAPTTTGAKNATLRFANNDPDENPINVALTGLGALPDIAVEPSTFDFGTVDIDWGAERGFLVRNDGTATLTVTALAFTGANPTEFAVTGGGAPFSLAPAGSQVVTVRFVPTSVGAKAAILRLSSNDPDTNPYDVTLTGLAAVLDPDITVQPLALAFGHVHVGSDSTRHLRIANVGADSLHVTNVWLAGPDSTSFTGNPAPFTLAPSDSAFLPIRFAPLSLGNKSALLHIVSDDPDASPWDIPLQGIGGVPDLAVDALLRDFGTVDTGSSITCALHLWNQGSLPLNVTSMSIAGTNASDFLITSNPAPCALAPGDSQQVVLRFTPAAIGPRSAYLRIASDDPVGGFIQIILTGLGTLPAPATVVFEGSVSGGSSFALSVSTASTVPALAEALYLAAVTSKDYAEVGAVTGLGLTWTRALAQCSARGETGIEVWMGRGAAVSGIVTATLSTAPENAVIIISRYSGVDAASPLGNMLAANTLGVSGPCGGGMDSAAFSVPFATGASNSLVFAAVAIRNKDLTPGTTWTQQDLLQVGAGADRCGAAVMDQTVSPPENVLLEGTFNEPLDWAVIGIEIRSGGSPSTAVPWGPEAVREAALRIHGGFGNTSPRFEITVPQAAAIWLTLHDARGRLVRSLWRGVLPGGRHLLDPLADLRPGVPSGIYFVRAELGSRTLARKLVLVR